MEETPKDTINFLVGDWNAKTGTDRESYEDVMGKYGIGNRNERGEMLLEFAKRNFVLLIHCFKVDQRRSGHGHHPMEWIKT